MWTTLNVPDSIIFNKTLEAQGVTMFDMGHLSLSVYKTVMLQTAYTHGESNEKLSALPLGRKKTDLKYNLISRNLRFIPALHCFDCLGSIHQRLIKNANPFVNRQY